MTSFENEEEEEDFTMLTLRDKKKEADSRGIKVITPAKKKFFRNIWLY